MSDSYLTNDDRFAVRLFCALIVALLIVALFVFVTCRSAPPAPGATMSTPRFTVTRDPSGVHLIFDTQTKQTYLWVTHGTPVLLGSATPGASAPTEESQPK